ncbi:protein translocase subunit SecD [Pelomicrobium methylotrophicum]|uniref:Protein translocase subunit SecD n=1 Tax=Pelomicrobium methylotrophicum TaxID=2602750 RepID=A0A5C7EIS8_9PROT|nr:protein translocase subunit SecD [Pelomicrobium methylotrophicum]TXF11969.1 protein translocase subunit SecD [Pelomicrobium methylotrophicum]
MNRYPLWKYLLIGAILLIGVLYTLPNFFPEVPAVQVTPARSAAKADAALLERVEAALKAANISYEGVFLDPTGVKVRFPDTDTQLKAKDLLAAQLGDNFVVALNLLSSSPRWLAAINALPMYLGLDLRGGVHFLLQVDMKAAVNKAAERYVNDLRTLLRENKILYSGISRMGSSVQIRFSDPAARAEAAKVIEKNYQELALREQGEGSELLLAATLKPEAEKRVQELALQQNLTTLRNRVNELGVAEPIIQQQGSDRIVVQLPGVQDTAKAKEILGRTATLEIRLVDETHDPLEAARTGNIPLGTELYRDRDGTPLLVKRSVVLTGDRITDAQPGFDSRTGEPAVHVTLDGTGARIFKNVTRENVGKRMAILLIEKGQAEVITAPVIREEIGGGRVQISGRMNTEEARDIALLLRAGALAAPMEIVEERTVGPSLGRENIEKGFNSTLYGFVAIAIFMSVYYRAFGVIAVVALATNVFLLVAILSMLQATLTLPGIAGIALTVGMAIDANVLIIERIREELRNGNTPQAAIHAGYERAFDTILDSNITTLIAGFALFWLGSGPVRGFAVTLCLGILTSIFSAVMVSRAITNLIYGRRRRLERLPV